jgi:cell division protein YceG involved in septum cleavage
MTLSNEFNKTMTTFSDQFENNMTIAKIYGKQKSEKDIIIMASLLEREANDATEAKTIAGILWKRIQRGIPLQVDATFLYTIQKQVVNLRSVICVKIVHIILILERVYPLVLLEIQVAQ